MACGIFVAACRDLSVVACRIHFPDQGSNPGPLPWERRVLATGPSGKSLEKPNIEVNKAVAMFPENTTGNDNCKMNTITTFEALKKKQLALGLKNPNEN